MASINFPNSPNLGDTFTVDGKIWTFNGIVWESNVTSYVGWRGYTGSIGEIGYTGSQGIQGPAGGYSGSVGYTGSQGSTGPTGYAGSQGSIGPTGYTGSFGYAGSRGYSGSVGYAGSRGYTGSAGTNGYTGSAGTSGYNGSRGYTGSRGAPLNIKGILNGTGELPSSTGDSYWTSVSLALHLDGTNGSTSFVDDSNNHFSITTYSGSPSLSTSQYKFGSASLYLDGASAIQTPSAAAAMSVTSPYTIDCWIYPTSRGVNYGAGIFDKSNSGPYGEQMWYIDTAGHLVFWRQFTIQTGQVTSTQTIPLNQWTHIALTYDGSQIKQFINGTLDGSVASAAGWYSSTSQAPTIGYVHVDGFGNTYSYFTGYIDDFRITSGVARYTGSFTAPTQTFLNVQSPLFGDTYIISNELYLYDETNSWTNVGPLNGYTGSFGQVFERLPTVPRSSSFVLQNANGATLSNSAFGVVLDAPAASFGARFAKYIDQPIPATPYSIILKSQPVYDPSGNTCQPVNIILRNSSTGRMIAAGILDFTKELVNNWNSYSSFSYDTMSPTTFTGGTFKWRKVTNDGTTLTFHCSVDGNYWIQYASTTLSSFISTVDEIGFGTFNSNRAVGEFLSWNVVSGTEYIIDTPTATQPGPYDLSIWQPGKPAAGQTLLKLKIPRPVVFANNFSGSVAAPSDYAATSSSVLSVKKNGSQIGTITYAAASSSPTFATTSGSVTYTTGDILSVIAPAVQDATLEGISITLVGTR